VSIEAINPATGEVLGSYPEHRDHEISTILDEAHEAWESWRATTFAHRGELMCRAAAALRERRRDLARLMALEMGKPVTQGDAEIEKCAWACEHFAERAEAYLATDVISTEAARSYVAFEPLGVVLAVMPWNFPFWQVFRFAAPALMAGNVGVSKHASNVPGCAVAIESIFEAAGFPRGAFRTLLIGSAEVRKVIEHRRVRAVTLTGSTPAGAAVAAVAGASIKKTVLELGGSDPYIVLDDAEVDRAAAICVAARIVNSGQSCIAAKRFIVAASRADVFVEHFVSGMKAKRVGDPLDDATCATSCTGKSRRRSRAGPRSSSAGRSPEAPGPTTLRPCSPVSRRGWRPTTKSSSARSRRSSRPGTKTTRSASRTTRASASEPRSSRRTVRAANAWPAASTQVPSS
jgi:succinate-semialdehyde dehydrogenase/glutarate-semialdehyde dehydrogenase